MALNASLRSVHTFNFVRTALVLDGLRKKTFLSLSSETLSKDLMRTKIAARNKHI